MADTSLRKLDYSLLQQCMHCGMCLPVCPTYDHTGLERHSPRGRIALMRSIADGEREVEREFAEEMTDCLGCLACMTACPAGVNYARLLEAARSDVETQGVLDTPARQFWRLISLRVLFMHPSMLRGAARLLRLWQCSGAETLARKWKLTRLLPADLRQLEPQTPRIARHWSDELIAPREDPVGPVLHRVALLTGCVQDLVFSSINRDTADVLLANGCSVFTPPRQGCGGSLHAHNGEQEMAMTLARRMIDLIPPEDFDAIISNAGGCGSHLKHYAILLEDDPRYADRAKLWDSKLKDIHEWLVEMGPRVPAASPFDEETVVTYDDSCHLMHGQRVVSQPRALLQLIPGLRYVELPEASWCCGSAGVYNITRPGESARLLARKVSHILATGAKVLATANPGCHLQIARGLREAGADVLIEQPVTLLARAYRREAGSSS